MSLRENGKCGSCLTSDKVGQTVQFALVLSTTPFENIRQTRQFALLSFKESAEGLHIASEGLGTDDALARAVGSLEDLKRLILFERKHAVSDGYRHVAGGKDADDAIGLADIAILDPCAARVHFGDNRACVGRRNSPRPFGPWRKSMQFHRTTYGSRIGRKQSLVIGLNIAELGAADEHIVVGDYGLVSVAELIAVHLCRSAIGDCYPCAFGDVERAVGHQLIKSCQHRLSWPEAAARLRRILHGRQRGALQVI